jgi:hypothetical protein
MVDIRTFFPVHLDAYETIIHQASHLLVLEAFMLHYMAPVTGRISDTDNDQFFFCSCLLESFLTPWIPVYGIMGMLQEVGTAFVDQGVGMAWDHGYGSSCIDVSFITEKQLC